MAIKTFNPTTPSRRNMTVLSYKGLSKVKPEKSLLEKVKKTAGRNSYGRITVRHIGGGNKKKYRIIDFKRQKLDVYAEVKTLEYDPNRSANIALVQYEDGEKAYILAPEGLKIGDKVARQWFVCPPVSCVTSVWTARLPSALLVTLIILTYSWVRLAVPVIWVSVRPFVVL